MISIGGLGANVGGTDPWLIGGPDPFARGLGVFDLTALQWADKFDADAEDYQSPSVVNQWYSSGKLSSVQWTSDDVQALFTPSNGSHSTTQPSGPSSHKSKINVGAIVGGVVGGIVALVCVAGLIWLWYRRRRKSVQQSYEKTPNQEQRSVFDGKSVSELHAQSQRSELAVSDGPYELAGRNA